MPNDIQLEVSGTIYEFPGFVLVDHPYSTTPMCLRQEMDRWPNFKEHFKKLEYVLDIGANTGAFSFLIKRDFPDCIIAAYEPIHMSAKNMERGALLNGFEKISIHRQGISSDARKVTVHMHPQNTGSASAYMGERDYVPFEIETVTLDSLVDGPVDLVKMDIEGMEFEVLKSFKGWDWVDALFLEVHPYPVAQSKQDQLAILSDLHDLLAVKMQGKPVWAHGLAKPFVTQEPF